ncbi:MULTISPECIES: DUF7824 domain-containing protein [Streptomyces]|uniref:DUF6493 family protein n=1 Tax=Streptomyces doudnae TaxID=3075536 RepID=A0ABD5EM81_9ACTN|nr:MULTISPECIES: DUF6493 family protein [unclassified Streptomyces]MDT0435700.1 DUF6493 family protein [Streptomyces sp. DSM 41981]MYQ62653.1 hypothetical protein [Streptomyces sp. SID4950]SCD41442.1 hypothetical protein GA0115242_1048161 [Streptomyces sp. SolWspMP-5a-2]
MSELMDTVRAGHKGQTVRLLDTMTDAERRAHMPELKALRKELRATRWDAPGRRAYPSLYVAGIVCQTGASAVAAWIAASDMRWPSTSPALLLRLLGDRPAEWLGDLAQRLAQRPVSSGVSYPLMSGLVRLAGCPVPTTEAYVRGWVDDLEVNRERGGTLLDRLRSDPHLEPMVGALFETNDIGGRLIWSADKGPDGWIGALALVCAEGRLDRKVVVDACVARLLRGGTTADSRAFLSLLTALDLTREERRERVGDWQGLASDAPSTVAAHAQSVLGELALAGELPPRQLAEMSEAVLFRAEKKLVRAQLVLLGKALARDGSAADTLLPAVAHGFGHQDPDVQERSLKLAERHLRKVTDPGVRADLVLASEQLHTGLRSRAADLLGSAPAAPEPEAHEEILPPFPEPTRLAPPPATAAEAAEEIGAALAAQPSVAEFERALDGLVRLAHQDREGLSQALEPVFARCWWDGAGQGDARSAESRFLRSGGGVYRASDGLEIPLAALRGSIRTGHLLKAVRESGTHRGCQHRPLAEVFEARLWEVAYRIRTEPLPFLLSTPSWSTGLLEPDELVDRLDAYRRLGARVAETDFAQALLRVRRADPVRAAAAAERAAALGTAEGARLAAWLTAETPWPTSKRRTHATRLLIDHGEVADLRDDSFPAAFRLLGEPMDAGRDWYCYHDTGLLRQWPALMPERRELTAARMVRDMAALALHDVRGTGAVLPQLAECGGEAGEATHLCLAYGLGARHPEDRLAAVDALLTLAADDRLSAERLGTEIRLLTRTGALKPARLAESLRTAAATGAYRTVWEVLGHALPPLLAGLAFAGTPMRGLGDLVGVAAECAERCGARGELPHLDQAADRRGSSLLVTQARRLRDTLALPGTPSQ